MSEAVSSDAAITPTSLTPPTPSSSHSPHTSSHSQPLSSSPNESPSPSSNPSLPLFSSGLYDALHPALSSCDAAITSVFTAQTQLAAQIDSLAALLASFQQLNKAAVFAPYTEKLRNAKRRVKRLQAAVQIINERMDDCREMVRRKEGLLGDGDRQRSRSTAGGLLSAPAAAEAALVGGLKGLTDKVVTSIASITQQITATAPARPAQPPAAPAAAAAAAAAEPKADDATVAQTARRTSNAVPTHAALSESADTEASDADAASSTSLPASFSDPAAIAATTETNNALLNDLLSWDQH